MRRNSRRDSDQAVLKLQDSNIKVTAEDSNIIAWLHMSLTDPNFDAPVGRGKVWISPLKGDGPVSTFPHASKALSFLKMTHQWPAISVHYIDKKRNRFIWTFMGRSVFVPLDQPLKDPRFVLQQLRNIMEHVGVSAGELSLVFSQGGNTSSSSLSKNGKDQVDEAGVDETFLSSYGSEIVDSRTVKAAAEAGIKTVEDLQRLVDDKGREAIVDLPGIGSKSAEKLTAILESQSA